MTVSSNYSAYTSYNSAATSSTVQKSKPDFETIAAEVMSSLDSDGSGSIDSTEFASALQSDSSADIFARIDTDSDGSMSSEEFMAALEASKPEHPGGAKEMGSMPPPPPPPSGGGNESESDSQSQTYSALDTNQDGTVSLEELLSGAQEKSADSSSASSSTSSEDKFSKLKTAMLESILSYYSSNSSSSSNSTSALNLSA
ncbi:EF-hand domain-containing protein [Sulfurimonas sp.]|uniref:EF-hand domain-containing protein n=1 Tax=Sulfurimonas sp. TaxID=2022749 RepID=UPI002622E07C|nr:EF-hand domain-containing protein [Sulfurimonas sp.]MDD3854491.1 EF-hand domain-containing protein [Sulfurimonas sp.]